MSKGKRGKNPKKNKNHRSCNQHNSENASPTNPQSLPNLLPSPKTKYVPPQPEQSYRDPAPDDSDSMSEDDGDSLVNISTSGSQTSLPMF